MLELVEIGILFSISSSQYFGRVLNVRFFQVLNEDLRLVIGQQDRMLNGANIWNFPVSYDKLGVRYRLWRDAVEQGVKQLPFTNQHKS